MLENSQISKAPIDVVSDFESAKSFFGRVMLIRGPSTFPWGTINDGLFLNFGFDTSDQKNYLCILLNGPLKYKGQNNPSLRDVMSDLNPSIDVSGIGEDIKLRFGGGSGEDIFAIFKDANAQKKLNGQGDMNIHANPDGPKIRRALRDNHQPSLFFYGFQPIPAATIHRGIGSGRINICPHSLETILQTPLEIMSTDANKYIERTRSVALVNREVAAPHFVH